MAKGIGMLRFSYAHCYSCLYHRLFKLTDEDLLHFRILSVGHRKELLVCACVLCGGVCECMWGCVVRIS